MSTFHCYDHQLDYVQSCTCIRWKFDNQREAEKGIEIFLKIYEEKSYWIAVKESFDRKLKQRGTNRLSQRDNGTRHDEHHFQVNVNCSKIMLSRLLCFCILFVVH